jgi:hypothetical protein
LRRVCGGDSRACIQCAALGREEGGGKKEGRKERTKVEEGRKEGERRKEVN